jgi:hypothetical protein
MHLAATPFPLCFDGQADQIVFIHRLSHTQQITDNHLASVLQQHAQFLPADRDLNTVVAHPSRGAVQLRWQILSLN